MAKSMVLSTFEVIFFGHYQKYGKITRKFQ